MSVARAAPQASGASLEMRLDAGASGLGLLVTPEQRRQLVDYIALLEHWNRTYNLIAAREPPEILQLHVLDSLATVLPLQRLTARRARTRIVDVGSGGGLPGVVLAVMNPDATVTCVDSVGKKAAFVQHAAGALRLGNLEAVHTRIEDLEAAPFDVVTCRAFSSLKELVRLTSPLLSDTGAWMAMKGKRPDMEIGELPVAIDVFHVEQLDVPGLAAERCLVWMRQASSRPI